MSTVTDVEVDRERAVTVTFDDGRTCSFPLGELRAACPCAQCRGQREAGQPVWPRPGAPETISIVDADLVGAWAISFVWSDGHATGIYPWDALRRWCDEGPGEVETDA